MIRAYSINVVPVIFQLLRNISEDCVRSFLRWWPEMRNVGVIFKRPNSCFCLERCVGSWRDPSWRFGSTADFGKLKHL